MQIVDKFFDNIKFPVENIKITASEKKYLHRLTDPHVHNYWEVKVFPEGFRKQFSPSVILVPPDIIHGATDNLFAKASNVSLAVSQPNIVLQKSSKEGCKEYYLPFLRLDSLCPGGVDGVLGKIKDLTEEDVSPDIKEKLLNELLSFFLEAVNLAADNNEAVVFAVTERACEFIERQYYRNDLTVEEIAGHVGVTAGHLANLFKKESLGTVRRYLIETRLKHAEKLLASGYYTVKDVTELTGWNSQFYFSNCFKKFYKISPSEVPLRKETIYVKND
jgi:AraC-like DNA-binding protein